MEVGSKVKLLHISQPIADYLDDNEVRDASSMLNEVFEVYEVDEYDCAWIIKWWDRGDGEKESHSLSLSSGEMEIVRE